MNKEKLTNDVFIERANNKHGNKYDYSLVDYVGSHKKVQIICNTHGLFEQIAYAHLNGQGCRKCSTLITASKKTHDNKGFIQKAQKIHKKYNYTLVDYKSSFKKIKIICPEHGEFEQTPDSHLRGSGCPNCNNLVLEPKLFNKIKTTFVNEKIISQGKPDWLVNKDGHKKQRFDIYFPDTNIGIEYQGIQHFKVSDYFQGEKGFLKIRMLDDRKYNLSIENGCKLFYFTYKRRDIPDNYPYKVYVNEEELINEIKKYINGR